MHPLDLWINGEADCAARLAQAAESADLLIGEGVMGLYDGAPSAADLASRFGLPVLLVVDASAMAGTFGAVVRELRTWRPALPWAGVFANRVGGGGHARLLRDFVDADTEWLGYLPYDAAFALPERHLGLTAAAELPDALAPLDAAADALVASPLGQWEAAAWRPPADDPLPAPARHLAGRTIAVARDAAFGFICEANVELLHRLGAEVAYFSPLASDALPPCDALWLPGGYPELHAERLAACTDLRVQLAAHVDAGRPVWAECGGMIPLFENLITADGRIHRMWGMMPGRVAMGTRLAALGPQQLVIGGETLRGHTFHWSRCETPLPPHARCTEVTGGVAGEGEPVYQRGALRASYFHAWFASAPALTARLSLAGALPG